MRILARRWQILGQSVKPTPFSLAGVPLLFRMVADAKAERFTVDRVKLRHQRGVDVELRRRKFGRQNSMFAGNQAVRVSSVHAMQTALEANGIIFIDNGEASLSGGAGVRLKGNAPEPSAG